MLYWLSDVLPLSYSIDAMQQIAASASWTPTLISDIGVILAFTAALAGGALALRRRTR